MKGERWFLKKCLIEYRDAGRFSDLALRSLELGLGTENTQGHVKHACGGLQAFFAEFPAHRATVGLAPTAAYSMNGLMLRDWRRFVAAQAGEFGPRSSRYSWETLRDTYLTPRYGGRHGPGGRGQNEFEIVARLLAEFL